MTKDLPRQVIESDKIEFYEKNVNGYNIVADGHYDETTGLLTYVSFKKYFSIVNESM